MTQTRTDGDLIPDPNIMKPQVTEALKLAHSMCLLSRWTPVEVRPNGVLIEKSLFGKTYRRFVGAAVPS